MQEAGLTPPWAPDYFQPWTGSAHGGPSTRIGPGAREFGWPPGPAQPLERPIDTTRIRPRRPSVPQGTGGVFCFQAPPRYRWCQARDEGLDR
jgi:hypothetical protein